MLSGAALIDVAILVIAANEGIKPQTREHLIALKAKKVNKIIIIQNKIDLLTKEQALKNYQEIKNFLKGTIAEDSPIIPISAQQNINIDKIKDALLEIPVPERDTTSKPEFLIARSFDINRPGTKIQELHGGVIAGIVSIYRGTHSIKKATPGGSLAFETELDNVLTKTDFLSGNIASTPDNLPEKSDKIKIRFELFPEVLGEENKMQIESLKTSESIMLSINTTITVGQITKLKNNEAEFSLKIPIIPIKGDSTGLARNIHGHWRLIGYGEII
jgi:translation initiation factor 2 subunit 3